MYKRQAQEDSGAPEVARSINKFPPNQPKRAAAAYTGLPQGNVRAVGKTLIKTNPGAGTGAATGHHYSGAGVPPNPYQPGGSRDPAPARKPAEETKINPRQVPRPRISL